MSAVEEHAKPAPGHEALGRPSLLERVDEPSPATDVRAVLRLYRDRGYTFERAWSRALRTLPRSAAGIEEWRSLLHRTKPVWKAAYEQRRGPGWVLRDGP